MTPASSLRVILRASMLSCGTSTIVTSMVPDMRISIACLNCRASTGVYHIAVGIVAESGARRSTGVCGEPSPGSRARLCAGSDGDDSIKPIAHLRVDGGHWQIVDQLMMILVADEHWQAQRNGDAPSRNVSRAACHKRCAPAAAARSSTVGGGKVAGRALRRQLIADEVCQASVNDNHLVGGAGERAQALDFLHIAEPVTRPAC